MKSSFKISFEVRAQGAAETDAARGRTRGKQRSATTKREKRGSGKAMQSSSYARIVVETNLQKVSSYKQSGLGEQAGDPGCAGGCRLSDRWSMLMFWC